MQCVRQTYPIQEAVGPEGHFPPEHQTAEGETERDKTNPVRTPFSLSLSLLCPSTSLLSFPSAQRLSSSYSVCHSLFSPPREDEERKEKFFGEKTTPKNVEKRENR